MANSLAVTFSVHSEQVDKLTATIDKLRGTIDKLTAPITRVTKAVNNQTGAFSKLGKAIGRIMFYRAIRTAMRNVTQSFREGVQHVVLYSRALNNLDSASANATMNEFATNLLYIKNSLGAMVMPVLQSLVPVVNAIADAFATAANAVNQFFHALKGESVFTKAKKYAVDYADGLDKASGSAKELKKQVFGFDELNIFNEPSKGGGGGGSGLDYSQMFEEAKVSDTFQQIRDLAMSAEWEQLGELFGKKLNDLVAKFDAKGVGTKIGKGLQSAVGTAFGLLATFNFRQAGNKLSETVNNIVGNVKWDEVGVIIGRIFTGAIDFGIGVLEEADVGSWAEAIKTVFVSCFDHITDWINSVDWVGVGVTFFQKVYDFVTNINFGEIATSFFTLLGTTLLNLFHVIEGFLEGVFQKWDEYCGVEAEDSGVEVVGKWLVGLWNGMVGIATWIYDNIVTPFFNALRGKNGFGLDEEGGATEKAGEDVIKNFLDGLKLKWTDVKTWITEKVAWFKSMLKGMSDFLTNKGGSWTLTPSMQNGQNTPKYYASGGQPESGSLFWAGESGAELVGQVGGRTTVTTHDQFSAGMESIMDNTNTVILQAAQALISAIQNKDMTAIVSIGDRDVVEAYDRGKRLAGASLVE